MATDKKLLISQVKVLRPFDQQAVPTKIRYSGKKYVVGRAAESAQEDSGPCFENFKIELGRLTRTQAQTSQQNVSSRHRRSVVGMTLDFLTAVLEESKAQIDASGDVFPKKILVAEPLSLEEEGTASGQWLSNYRANIRTALAGHFEDIDFLPEPFAVFQYYRYGIRHPMLAEGQKHVALVLDFGGGTLDISVIETTADGDISHGGKNSRPLSAKSISAAGFYINQRLAEDILFTSMKSKEDKANARKIISKVKSFQGIGDEERSLLSEKEATFVESFTELLAQVENAKVRICNSISDWSLNANLHGAVSHLVRVAENPFLQNSPKIEIPLRAERLREVFESRVWQEKLRDAIGSAVTRAHQELGGKPISVVLLSGGSTNIRWLKRLIERDLKVHLQDAEILEISENYQEVVAKGLAIECARQFYTEGDGDFGAVTYNRLNLGLRPDGEELEWCQFRPLEPNLPKCDDSGTLLPSSTSLRAFLDRPMRWKARLKGPPRTNLQYHYLKSSFDPTDLNSLHNIVDDTVRTPKGTAFGSTIEVELTVRHDGTAKPAFVYAKGTTETRVEGVSFFLDMTFADSIGTRNAYLGLDFGTATSAVSLVSQDDITAYVQRSRDSSWLELGELVQTLPYPVAHPLAMYITQTNQNQLEKFGLASLEAALTFIAFVSLCDLASTNRSFQFKKHFRDFRRSAGPLKHLIVELRKLADTDAPLARDLLSIVDDVSFPTIDQAVTEAAKAKHFKRANVDYNQVLSLLGNHLRRALKGRAMGVIEGTERKGFGSGYRGIFRCLEGPNYPFVKLYDFGGERDFFSAQVLMVNLQTGSVCHLSPFYLWGLGATLGRSSGYDLYAADILNPSEKHYNYCGSLGGEEVSVSAEPELSDVCSYLTSLMDGRINMEVLPSMSFFKRET